MIQTAQPRQSKYKGRVSSSILLEESVTHGFFIQKREENNQLRMHTHFQLTSFIAENTATTLSFTEHVTSNSSDKGKRTS